MNLTQEQKAVIALNLVPYLGYGQFQKLVACLGSAKCVLDASEKEISSVEGISARVSRELSRAKNQIDFEKEIASAEKIGAKIITYLDENYPAPLRDISDYPPVIYVLGSIKSSDFSSIAIVGTRKPTPYGLSVARSFSRDFARAHITCVSGLARGIDSEVHKACIEENARTIAVLGNGLNRHYPPENRKLEQEIIRNGALMSEFPVNASPDKANFPRRNRIIAALSLGVVVVEASEKSGSLITAKHALEQGKDVFAVPGSIFSRQSKGTHGLLKNGAFVAESAEDVIEEISPFKKLLRTKKTNREAENSQAVSAGSFEEKILTILENETDGMSIDTITGKCDLPSSEIAASLLGMELKGMVRALPGKIYVKTR